MEKYNLIQEKTKDGLAIHDPERLIVLMEELEHLEQELHGEYQAAIEKELPLYAKVQKKPRQDNYLMLLRLYSFLRWEVHRDITMSLFQG